MAMPEGKRGPLPIPENMRLQERTWRIQRIRWTLIALFVALALLGVFSNGPCSETSVSSSDGSLDVEYQRFARRTARTHFAVRAVPGGAEVTLRLSAAFADAYDIEAVYPLPVRNAAGGTGMEFTFVPSEAGDLRVAIAARPKRFGVFGLEIAAVSRGSVSFTQVIYP